METENQYDDFTIEKDNFSQHSVTSSRRWEEVEDVMRKNVVTVSSNESIVLAAGKMSEHNISSIVVMDSDTIVGIVTERDLLRKVTIQEKKDKNDISRIMSYPVTTIPPHTSIFEAGRIMKDKKIKRLPIAEDEKLVGIVTQTDLIRVLASYGMWREVSEIMSREVAVIDKNRSALEAAKTMALRRISSIVISEEENIIGILTERDFIKKIIVAKKNPNHIKIEKIMSSPVVKVAPNSSVLSACTVMEKMRIRRLVVMEEEKLLGIVSQTDIFKAVEAKLEEQEKKNFYALEKSDDNIYATDKNGRITYTNPAFMKLLEVTVPIELVGQIFLPEKFWDNLNDRAIFLENFNKKGKNKTQELALKTTKGKKIHVTLFSNVTQNNRGDINGSQGILYDITAKKELLELKKIEMNLIAATKEWERTFDAISDFVFIQDKDSTVIKANKALIKLLGLSEKEIVGRKCYEVMHGRNTPWDNCPYEMTKEDLKPHTEEVDDPNIGISLLVTSSPILNDKGELIGNIRLAKDISVQKKAEKEVGDAKDRLEAQTWGLKKTNEAVKTLYKELEESAQELEKLNHLKSDFVSIVSHELRTPIAIVKESVSQVLEGLFGEVKEEQKEFLEIAVNTSDRLLAIVSELLDLSKIEAGKFDIKPAPFKMKDLVESVITTFRARAKKKEVDLKSQFEKDTIEICADRSKLEQVFVNLLGNALKFTEKGSIEIKVTEEEGEVKCVIQDTGKGISEENLPKLFGKFTQVGELKKGTEKGTGLGLAISKSLVELHGGKIWAESKLGEGTRIIFTIPKSSKNTQKKAKS